jgi:2-polyprenyl-6-hydroxyphenyl methylase/3-demethylubiquinone-9 3-methyltransferase
MQTAEAAGVSPQEIARFDALAGRWWDPAGPMRPLHAMNRLRTEWVLARVRARFAGAVRLLDVGCGGGLAAEAFARAGHDVLGLDAAARALDAGRAHAAGQGLSLEYRCGLAADLRAEGARFAVITALEVIEHVPEPGAFLAELAALLEPGGLLFVSTLNRTARSFAVAKLGAEYVLRLLPAGTHDWRKFITPAELGQGLRGAGLRLADITGMVPDPLRGGWRASRNLSVNYLAMAEA